MKGRCVPSGGLCEVALEGGACGAPPAMVANYFGGNTRAEHERGSATAKSLAGEGIRIMVSGGPEGDAESADEGVGGECDVSTMGFRLAVRVVRAEHRAVGTS